MKKMIKRIFACFLVAICFWCGGVMADRRKLDADLQRFQAMAGSVSRIGLQEAAADSLHRALEDVSDVDAAKAYISSNLEHLRLATDRTLRELGCDPAELMMQAKEAFAMEDEQESQHVSVRIFLLEKLGELRRFLTEKLS